MPLILAHPGKAKTISAPTIEVGLVNNLSDAGLERGERQIIDLLADCAGDETVRLSLFSLPSIKRDAATWARIETRYMPFTQLVRSSLHGLIVTGCEPQADILPNETFWRELTQVVDWAEHNTRSTIWSCLAAQAAVLHLDGIERRRLPTKRTGLFFVTTMAQHPLLVGVPHCVQVPHSRWNELDPKELIAGGYQVLTRGEIVGVDTFVKPWRSLFVYLQGHPEYDAEALGREYRRDVLRYLYGASDEYPTLPEYYFDPPTEAILMAFATKARMHPGPGVAAALSKGFGAKTVGLGGLGRPLVANWLRYLADPASGLRLAQPVDTIVASV